MIVSYVERNIKMKLNTPKVTQEIMEVNLKKQVEVMKFKTLAFI